MITKLSHKSIYNVEQVFFFFSIKFSQDKEIKKIHLLNILRNRARIIIYSQCVEGTGII